MSVDKSEDFVKKLGPRPSSDLQSNHRGRNKHKKQLSATVDNIAINKTVPFNETNNKQIRKGSMHPESKISKNVITQSAFNQPKPLKSNNELNSIGKPKGKNMRICEKKIPLEVNHVPRNETRKKLTVTKWKMPNGKPKSDDNVSTNGNPLTNANTVSLYDDYSKPQTNKGITLYERKRDSKQNKKFIRRNNKNKSTSTTKLLEELALISNNAHLSDIENIAALLVDFQPDKEDNTCVINIIETVKKVYNTNPTCVQSLLLSVCSHKFLKTIQTFMLQHLKDYTKTENGKEKCEIFINNVIILADASLKLLSLTDLLHLKHTIILIRTILARMQGMINSGVNHIGIKQILSLINERVKREESKKDEMTEAEINNAKIMSVLPTNNDIFGKPPELKRNIIDGAYKSVEHYLAVQFQLLREDFMAPLREGIADYLSPLKSGCKRNNSGVLIYRNVKILKASISSGKLGHEIKLGERVKWDIISDLFIFGSLLLFTINDFKSFFLGTVIELNNENRTIIVKLNEMHNTVCENIYLHEFVIAASKTFFEPYFHVLSALQQMDVYQFPMEKYIIKVDSDNKLPAYITELGLKTYKIFENPCIDILEPSWPEFNSVKFNRSQHIAFQAALTNEFVAIQGPPGTGKTFLAHQIVETLLDNVKTGTPILVVCYKNHALDQFLEGIMNKTTKIIRIGGRSKNEKLKEFNIKQHRKKYGYGLYADVIQKLAKEYFSRQYYIDGIKKHGIVSIKDVLPYISCSEFKSEMLSGNYEDWLMEGVYVDEETDILDKIKDDDFSHQYGTEYLLTDVWINSSDSYVGIQELGDLETGCLGSSVTYPPRPEQNQKSLEGSILMYNDGDPNIFELEKLEINCDSDGLYKSTLETIATYPTISEGNQKSLEEIYIDDYSDIYNNDLKKLEHEKYEINCDINGPLKSKSKKSSTVAPTFVITIHNLKAMCEMYEEKIQRLLSIEYSDLGKYYGDKIKVHVLACENNVKDLKARISFLKRMVPRKMKTNEGELDKLYKLSKFSIWSLTTKQRWALYYSWLNGLAADLKKEMIEIEEAIRVEEQNLDNARNLADLDILRSADVVGITTTGAAKLRPVLNKLGAKIVVIEEAAEVLESHIVTALSDKCQHLIMIGDHQQLRPNPAVYELCKKFNFDISLFERMIKNGLSYYTLNVQHRMRPEFASLIVPAIYSQIFNHTSVLNRPDIKGVNHNMFFINHTNLEEQLVESVTHVNKYEANYVVELVRYLLLQGYRPEEITILTTYLGQVRCISKIIKNTLPSLSDVRVCSVDDFQGEENKIVILSLVRSNEEKSIGFLKIENRVCVALSRARDGLYIIGNMDLLSENSNIWPKVKERLVEHNAIGDSLSVFCQNHPGTVTLVRDGSVLEKLPEGGCHLKCNALLNCGHMCKFFCHPRDQNHQEIYLCSAHCERKICKRNHPCPLPCAQKCLPCKQPVQHKFPCEHEQTIHCSEDTTKLKCQVELPCIMPCGHDGTRKCFEDEDQAFKRKGCYSICGKVLPCNHTCNEMCCIIKPLSVREIQQGLKCFKPQLHKCILYCKTQVEITLECGHKCTTNCQNVYPEDKKHLIECDVLVEKVLPCSHSHPISCSLFDTIEYCHIEVEKTLNCGHKQQVECSRSIDTITCEKSSLRKLPCGHELIAKCSMPPSNVICTLRCSRILPCGHQCEELCSSLCKCSVLLQKELQTCGHKVHFTCGLEDKVKCNKPCKLTLPCGHTCQARCGQVCNSVKCHVLVECHVRPDCGHGLVNAPCYLNIADDLPEFQKNAVAKELSTFCKAACDTKLECGHVCPGSCRSCKQKHAECDQPCNRNLACGHFCQQKCKEKCPPCYMPCLNRCSHKKCQGICGEPCTPCQEACTSLCVHWQCIRPCFFICNRRPCSRPCQERLACGHLCNGFCGEVCPTQCLQCNSQSDFPIDGLVISRYVVLEDCGHTMEAMKLDSLFYRNFERIVKCPIENCQQPVITTKRYQNQVKVIFKSIMRNKRIRQVEIMNLPMSRNQIQPQNTRRPYQYRKNYSWQKKDSFEKENNVFTWSKESNATTKSKYKKSLFIQK